MWIMMPQRKNGEKIREDIIMYKIIAKSALAQDQIKAKLNIGCDGIEIQLCNELLGPKGIHDWIEIDKIAKLDKFIGKNIVTIHAPILQGESGDPVLEWLVNDSDVKLLDQIFYIANFIGDKEDRDIRIVIHSEASFEMLNHNGQWPKIVTVVGQMLEKYPRTVMCIENVTPIRKISSGSIIQVSNNFYDDNVKMCKALRKALKTDRIGVVLDTCHQTITEKYMNLIYALSPHLKIPDYSIDYYMKTYAPYLKIIHLADARDNGYGKNHGIPFTEPEKFNHIMDLICKYADEDCYITLEVMEEDYLFNKNYRKQKQMVDSYFERKTI